MQDNCQVGCHAIWPVFLGKKLGVCCWTSKERENKDLAKSRGSETKSGKTELGAKS